MQPNAPELLNATVAVIKDLESIIKIDLEYVLCSLGM